VAHCSPVIDLVIYTLLNNTTGQNGSLFGKVPLTIYFRGPRRVNIVLSGEANRIYGICSVRDDMPLPSYVGHYSEVISNDFALPARKTRECQIHDMDTYFRIPEECAWTSQVSALPSCFKYFFLVLFT
jgi:hypothetical protein